MIRYIASDMDGTLLQGDAQSLNPEVFDLILQLKEKGIHFIAASGRQYYSLRNLFEPIKDEISYVSDNGSLCIDQGKVIYQGEIPRELALRILDASKKYPGCHTLFSCAKKCYTDSTDPDFFHRMKNVVHFDIEQVDDMRQITEPFIKIAMCDFEGTKNLEPYFKDLFSDEIKVVTSGNEWVDFIAPNTNKGLALAKLLAHLNISPEDGMAFGDQYNDVEMLQLAGTSYAMSKAAPGIAYYSTYVTDSVEEVLRDLIASV